MKNKSETNDFNNQVFINCPYDDNYSELFDALVFAILDCGFSPRCAKEVQDSGEVRIGKILKIIKDCKFGVHDLSRTELSVRSGLPRFNMSFELGIFLGAKEFGNKTQKAKVCLVLDKEQYRYQTFLSDIAGQDIRSHANEVEIMISLIREWLNPYSSKTIAGGTHIASRFGLYKKELRALCAESRLKLSELTYFDYVKFAGTWISQQDNLPKSLS